MQPKERTKLTLCLIHQHPRILLGMKKRGFGSGRWNGFGGKVLPDETLEEAARRELKEECCIEPAWMKEQGILEFDFEGKEIDPLEVHIYRIEEFRGKPTETEEMKPQWFIVDEIPFAQMWSDDVYWMPLFLKGKKFKGWFLFDSQDRVVDQHIWH